MVAVNKDDQAKVKKLLLEGANVNDGEVKPLYIAACVGNLEMVKLLKEFGAYIDARSGANTPLMIAAFLGYYNIVEYLVKAGAATFLKDAYGQTPLMLAKKFDYLNIIKFLNK